MKGLVCFKCEKKGHYARDCKPSPKDNPILRLMVPPGNKPTAHIFNMVMSDVLDDKDDIAGIMIINYENAYVLIHLCATRSLSSEIYIK